MSDRRTILVVDGDSESERSLTLLLSAEGYSVKPAQTAAQAVAAITADPPDLILLDINAPGTGFEAFRRLRASKRSRDIPLLLISGESGLKNRSKALRLGAADFISRPFQREELMYRVRKQLELSRVSARMKKRTPDRSAPPGGDGEPAESGPATGVGNPDALRESEGWIRLAMQAGRMSAFEWNPATDEVRRSHYYSDIFGDPANAALDTGRNWFRRIHPDDRERFLKILSILSPVYDTYDTQYRVLHPDGRIVTLRESARAFFDAAGHLTRLIGIVADITEHKEAEEALKRNEAELGQLIQKVPIAIACSDEAGRIYYVNDCFVKTFGYTLDEISEPGSWWERAFPDERDRRAAQTSWQQSLEEPREYQVTCKDGTVRTAEIFGATVCNRRLILFKDITERKRAEAAIRESEERFRNIADTAPVTLWTFGSDNRLTWCNKHGLALTGRTLDELTGDRWMELVHPDDLARLYATLLSTMQARRSYQFEYRLRAADGQYRWMLATGTPRFTADGLFTGYMAIDVDISGLKRDREQMLARQKLESLGVLASGIAHDFNNLLGCILADSELALSESDPDSPVRETLQGIKTVAVRASEIVAQMMNFAGQDKTEFERVDVCRLVREMLRLLKISIPKKSVLKTNLPANLPAVHANAAQIRQVVMNLIMNAAEALGEKPGEIAITARSVHAGPEWALGSAENPPEGDYLCLEVSDTGTGMPEEVQNRIFEPFFTTKFAGRGLGLAAVQGIVRGHGGAIRVSSAPGQGTTFQILLPCVSEAAPEVQDSAVPKCERVEPGKGTVLVVEDEDELRRSVCKMLQKKGFAVAEAADGTLAVEWIHSRKDELAALLLDLTLPGKSSREVLEEARRAKPGVRVVLTSAYGQENIQAAGLQCDAFLRKPYNVANLLDVLRETASGGRAASRSGQSGGA
jgi:PAS domain S-box-containing protein